MDGIRESKPDCLSALLSRKFQGGSTNPLAGVSDYIGSNQLLKVSQTTRRKNLLQTRRSTFVSPDDHTPRTRARLHTHQYSHSPPPLQQVSVLGYKTSLSSLCTQSWGVVGEEKLLPVRRRALSKTDSVRDLFANETRTAKERSYH